MTPTADELGGSVDRVRRIVRDTRPLETSYQNLTVW
jgi:hypothetical protein